MKTEYGNKSVSLTFYNVKEVTAFGKNLHISAVHNRSSESSKSYSRCSRRIRGI